MVVLLAIFLSRTPAATAGGGEMRGGEGWWGREGATSSEKKPFLGRSFSLIPSLHFFHKKNLFFAKKQWRRVYWSKPLDRHTFGRNTRAGNKLV